MPIRLWITARRGGSSGREGRSAKRMRSVDRVIARGRGHAGGVRDVRGEWNEVSLLLEPGRHAHLVIKMRSAASWSGRRLPISSAQLVATGRRSESCACPVPRRTSPSPRVAWRRRSSRAPTSRRGMREERIAPPLSSCGSIGPVMRAAASARSLNRSSSSPWGPSRACPGVGADSGRVRCGLLSSRPVPEECRAEAGPGWSWRCRRA